jgi:hypothetical protein
MGKSLHGLHMHQEVLFETFFPFKIPIHTNNINEKDQSLWKIIIHILIGPHDRKVRVG